MRISHILISRTDSIGDVVLTLPLAGLLKLNMPDVKISFLGMPYTKDVIESCSQVDQFIDWQYLQGLSKDEALGQFKTLNADVIIHVFPREEIAKLAKKASIPNRIGTTGRIYHWWTCNKLVAISRKNSDLHEALLNLKLAKPLIGEDRINQIITYETGRLSEIRNNNYDFNHTDIQDGNKGIPSLYGLSVRPEMDSVISSIIDTNSFNLILHPRSKGSAREWGLKNYGYLAANLAGKRIKTRNGDLPCKVFITGTKAEGEMLSAEGFFDLAGHNVVNMTGAFNLKEFMQFIASADALIAGSTGPLHIASALGKITLGLYPPIRPMHPGRWAPLGIKADYLVADKECSKCRNEAQCECMKLITTDEVQQKLEAMVLKYYSQTMLA